ncbi:MAG: YqcC family protein [bacterium]|nr:YqcC family protein [bacterium]
MTADRITAAADDVERTMRRLGAWTEPPPLRPFAAPFGMDAMPFEHWIQLVLVPRLREIARTGAPLPPSSNLAGHAVREFDGRDDMGPLVDVLRRVDGLPGSARAGAAAPGPAAAPAQGMALFMRARAAGGLAAVVGVLIAIAASDWASTALRGWFLPTVTASFEGTIPPSDAHVPLRATFSAGVRDDGRLVPGDGLLSLHRRGIPVPGDFAHVAEPLPFAAAAPPAAETIRAWLVRVGVDPEAQGLGPAAQEMVVILAVAAAEPTRAGLDEVASRLPLGTPEPQLFDLETRTPGWVDTAAGIGAVVLVCVPILLLVVRRVRRRQRGH